MTKCGAGGLGRECTSARRVPNQDESRSTSAVASSGRIRSPVPQSHTRWILVTGAARRASRKSRRVAPNLLSISMRAGACQSPLRMTGPPLELITIGEERSAEHTSELQSRLDLVCRLLLEKKKARAWTTAAADTSNARLTV